MSTNKIITVYDTNHNTTNYSVDEIITRGLNRHQSWICGAGIKNLYIDYDGNVWRCNNASSMRHGDRNQLIDFNEQNLQKHTAYLGNIDQDFMLPNSWVTCPWKSCPCGADVLIPKAAPKHTDKIKINGPIDLNEINDQLPATISSSSVASETYFQLDKQILWDIGRRCNFSCSYCWPGSHNNYDKHLEWQTITNTCTKLISAWADNKKIHWYFGGGEPTVHPKFLDWMKWLKDNDQWTLVTTNGSRPAKYWREAAKFFNGINLSVHFEYFNENKLLDNISAICECFSKSTDQWLEIKLMATPLNLDKSIKFKELILQTNLLDQPFRTVGTLSLVPIRHMTVAGQIVDYTHDQLQLLANQ